MENKRFGIFGRRKTKAYGLATATPRLMEALQLFDGSVASYGHVYRRLHPVRTVVDFIAGAVATTPLKVYRRAESGRPEARDHPFAELLRHPNPELTTRRLIWGTVADLAIYGNAYWRKIEQGRNRFLVPLPPFRVTPRGGDLLSAGSYDFFRPDGGAPQTFSRDEIVHFKFYDPEDRRVGSSKLEALRAILLEEVEASAYRKGFWKNRARIEGVLKHPGILGDEAAERLRVDFENLYTGSNNSGKTAILEEGMEFAPMGFSPHDAEFVQGREFVLTASARVFNLPLSLLGLTESATYASQREFRKQLYTEVLPDWYEPIQTEIELQLMPWFTDVSDIYPEFLVESKLRGDFVDQANLVFQATGRPYMTVHEARDLFNMADRRESQDDELAIPVGPNFALESNEPALLAPVTPLPARAASGLEEFFDRQERSVLARLGAGSAKAFDRDRWDRELTMLLKNADLAHRINIETELQLYETDNPREVFKRAREERAHLALDVTATQA